MTFRSTRLFGVACVLLLVLGGCSKYKEGMKPQELQRIEASQKLEREWSNFVGTGQDSRYARLQHLILKDKIYTVDVAGVVTQLDTVTGDKGWEIELETEIGGGVGSGGGLIFVGSLAGEVIAIDPEAGQVKWRVQASSEILSAPQGNDEVVIVSAIDGQVYAYDLKDGTLNWNYHHPVPVLSLRSTGSPLVLGEHVFIGFDNGQLLSFNCTNGQLVWSARVGQPQGKTELNRLVDVDASPIEYGPYIYGAGYNSRMIAVSRAGGNTAWAQDLSTAQNITAAEDIVVVSDIESHVKAFNALNGQTLWENTNLHRRSISPPAIMNGVVVVVDFEGVIHGLSLKTGELVARAHSPHESVLAQPIVLNNLLYVLDIYGEVSAYSIKAIPKKAKKPKKKSKPNKEEVKDIEVPDPEVGELEPVEATDTDKSTEVQ